MNQTLKKDPLLFNPDYHELIGLIYDGTTNRDGFLPFLNRFIEIFQGHSGTFAIYDIQSNLLAGCWVVNIPEEALAFYAEHVAHQDLLVQTALTKRKQKRPRFVASNLDIENVREVGEGSLAYEWLRSYGAAEAAGAVAYLSGSYLNFFGIQRASDQPDFTRNELAVFDLFLPHISRALEIYIKMSDLNVSSIPERSALDRMQQGILICDSAFKVAFKNHKADEIIANNPSLHVSPEGLLSCRDKSFSHELALGISAAVNNAANTEASSDKVLCYRQDKQSLTIIISPLSAEPSDSDQNSPRGGAMISLYDWTNRPQIRPEVLQRFFGLSRTESTVSALLLSGQSPADIAAELNRSRETVKSHLQSIYRKTNTNRQGELVALLAASVGLA